MDKTGPLQGVKVVEIAGLGPAPMCGMILADMGADVVLIDRLGTNPNAPSLDQSGKEAFFKRGKRSIAMDLKKPEAIAAALDLIDSADLLIEGFRPGVVERLGLGPDVCLGRNPKLVYGRMTGWGQTGPLADAAGHDINFIAVGGALYYSGMPDSVPYAPSTVIGDVAGGALMLALGLVSALHHSRSTGEGQVIDAAITDGTAYVSMLLAFFQASGILPDGSRGNDFLTGGAPWSNVYETADEQFVSIGSLEPAFYANLVAALEVKDDPDFADQWDKSRWPAAKAKLIAKFKSRTRAEWCELMEGTDICFGPVLNLAEAAAHPHNVARDVFVEIDGFVQPSPAPKFGKTKAQAGRIGDLGADTSSILAEVGYSAEKLESMREAGAI